MAYFTYAATGRPGHEDLGVAAFHDQCVPEEIKHFEYHPPIVHVDLNNRVLPGYWTQAPGWLWANWQAGYPCNACGQPC